MTTLTLRARASIAAGLFAAILAAPSLAQDDAPPAGGEMPAIQMPAVPDIATDFTDAMKSPEAIKAAEEALKATAAAYRGAKAYSDTLTIVVDMMGRRNEQSMSVDRDATGTRLGMGPMSILSVNSKVYLLSDEAPSKFVAYPLEGSIVDTLGKALGGFDLPFPKWTYPSTAVASWWPAREAPWASTRSTPPRSSFRARSSMSLPPAPLRDSCSRSSSR
jgi:hypothetical protein